MDSVNSTTFIKRPPFMTDTQEKFLYTKELLLNRIFLGCYQERRYVKVLNEYWDVVVISPEETDLHNDLDKLRKKWLGVQSIKWVGITGPDSVVLPKAYCFWVKFTNLPFGFYWFQIRHVKLVEEKIFLQLKYIRKSRAPLTTFLPQSTENQMPPNKNEKAEALTFTEPSSNELLWNFDFKKSFLSLQQTWTNAIHIIQPNLTWKNFFLLIKLGCALTLALILGIVSLLGHLGEYVLKVLRELTLLIHAFTPIIIQLIDFLSKIVGGFYILIAGMFFRNHVNVQPHRNHNLYSIPYSGVPEVLSQIPPTDWRKRNQILKQELLSNEVNRN